MYTLTLIPINDQVHHKLTVDQFTGLNGLFIFYSVWIGMLSSQ